MASNQASKPTFFRFWSNSSWCVTRVLLESLLEIMSQCYIRHLNKIEANTKFQPSISDWFTFLTKHQQTKSRIKACSHTDCPIKQNLTYCKTTMHENCMLWCVPSLNGHLDYEFWCLQQVMWWFCLRVGLWEWKTIKEFIVEVLEPNANGWAVQRLLDVLVSLYFSWGGRGGRLLVGLYIYISKLTSKG